MRTRPPVRIALVLSLGAVLLGCNSPPRLRAATGPEGFPRPPAVRGEGEIRIANLNAWAIPAVSKELHDRLGRMGAAVASFRPDVVCFQEVFTNRARARILAGLGEGWHATVGHPGGLLVASRWPLRDVWFTRFPVFPGLDIPERLARKGMLQAVVRTPAGDLRVVTAHLALAFGEDNPRSKQLEFLLRRLDAHRDLPLVVAADLNTPPLEDALPNPDYLEILARGFVPTDPIRQDAHGRWLPPAPTRVGWPRYEILTSVFFPDHILLRDGATTRVVLRAYGLGLDGPDTAVSDHNLLVADVALEPR